MNQFENNYLEHHGVKGQKWGVRRYQPYPDGHSGGKEIGKAAKSSVKYGGKKNKEANPIKTSFESTAQMSRSAATLQRRKNDIKAREQAKKEIEKENLSEMSDKELRDRVNRMQTEQQYIQLKENQIKRGQKRTDEFLDRFGDRVMIAASAASLAVSILKIRQMIRGESGS